SARHPSALTQGSRRSDVPGAKSCASWRPCWWPPCKPASPDRWSQETEAVSRCSTGAASPCGAKASVGRTNFAHPAVADEMAVLPLVVCAGVGAGGAIQRAGDRVPGEVNGRGRQCKACQKCGCDFPHDAILSSN